MYQIGLLLLTGSFRMVVESISQYLKCANKNVIKRLYVKLEPDINNPFTKSEVSNLRRLSDFVPVIYNNASSLCQNLDVRLILSDARKRKADVDRTSKFDVVLTNWDEEIKKISNYVDCHFKEKCSNVIRIHDGGINQSDVDCSVDQSAEFQNYNTVCLGGTFDRLHNGHKVLLSEAALRATNKLIIGVTNGPMLKRKVLWELIEPVEQRILDVTSFLLDVDPSLYYEVLPITDPYGPTIVNPDIDCIVVSAETKLGGEKVNYERKIRGMSELSMYIVDLVENADKIPGEEEKLSSSTRRLHLLGTCLKDPLAASKNNIYTAFLQGQPMSGKSHISDCFKNRGAIVIDCCDIVKSILNNKKENKAIFHEFSDCLSKDGESVDYRKLMHHCLKDKERRQWIADNLHEKVEEKIKLKIQTLQKGNGLILIQDSLLLDGYFKSSEVNEVWCTVTPVTEITKRLVISYDLSEEDATNAVLSLPSNEEYIKKSNRVFSSHWTSEITEQQITRAWSDIKLKIQ